MAADRPQPCHAHLAQIVPAVYDDSSRAALESGSADGANMKHSIRSTVIFALLAAACALAEPPRNIVVGGMTAAAGSDERDNWTPTAIEEVLNARLRRTGALTVVPSIRTFDSRRELTDGDGAAPDWKRVAQALGAARLICGETSGPAYALTLKLKIIDCKSDEKPLERSFGPARINELLDQATTYLLEQFSLTSLSESTRALVLKPPTDSPTALEYFARAILSAREGNWSETARYLKQACEYESTFIAAQLALAQVESRSAGGARLAALRLRQMRLLAKAGEDPWDAAEVERIEGVLLALTGGEQNGAERLESAAAMSEKIGDVYGQILALDTLADLEIRRANQPADEKGTPQSEPVQARFLKHAAEVQSRILELLAPLNDLVTQASGSNRLALLYERLGEMDKALKQHQTTLELARKLGVRQSQATAQMFLGQYYRHAGRYPEALEAIKQCLDLAVDSSKPGVHIALGDIHKAMNDERSALQEYESAFENLKKSDNLTDQFTCLKRLAEARHKLGQKKEAARNLQEAIDVAQVLKLPELQTLREQLAGWSREAP